MLKKVLTNLTFWVLTAITAGALLGHFFPEQGVAMEFLGKGFINIVKIFISPIIFLTISLGISGMNDLKKVGRVGGKAIIYFEVVTTLALIIGVAVAYVIQPGAGIVTAHGPSKDVATYAQKAGDFSWWQFFRDNLTVQVLLASIATGIMLSHIRARERVIKVLTQLSRYVFKALHF
ncbi:MAG TPA: cation:dicarboxylase symporter family transporter, partial [Chryseolinea sp.]|nr:cation:dicarboxylase symporter family transporter [Chryseolinea sp.]